MKTVAVIGAGLSGLLMAKALSAKASISVFEKARGVSGRLSTRRAQHFQFDHGAPCFNVKNDSFKQLLKPLLREGLIKPWAPRMAHFHEGSVVVKKVSDDSCTRYVAVPGMNALCKYLSQALTVHLNTQVSRIARNANKWSLFDEKGDSLGRFDWVISSIPAQQAAVLLPNSLSFYDELASVDMKACFAVLLGFNVPPKLAFDAAILQNEMIHWVSVDSSKPGRPSSFSMVLHSNHEWTRQCIDSPKENILSTLLIKASELMDIDLLTATHQSLHLWRYAQAISPSTQSYFLDKAKQIGVCGDWCLRSDVESAFLSSQALSSIILQHLSNDKE